MKKESEESEVQDIPRYPRRERRPPVWFKDYQVFHQRVLNQCRKKTEDKYILAHNIVLETLQFSKHICEKLLNMK